jgi:hypothetical protein
MRSRYLVPAMLLASVVTYVTPPMGHASDRCTELASLAAAVAEHKAAGIPQADVSSQLRAQYKSDTEDQRNANAMTERVVMVVYQLDKAPNELRQEVQERCEAGEFDQRNR